MKKAFQLLPLTLVLVLGDTGRAQLFGETFDGSWPNGDASFVTDNNPPWSSSDAWQNNGLLRYGSVPGGGGTNNVVGWIGGLAYAGAGAVDGPTTPLPASLDFQIYPGAGNPFYQATITVDQNLANASNIGGYTDDGKRDVFGWAVKDINDQVIMSLKFVHQGDGTMGILRNGIHYDTAIIGYTGAWWDRGTETTIGNGASEDVVGLFNRGEWTTLDIALNTLNGTWSATLSDIYGDESYAFIVNAPTAAGTTYIGSLAALWEPSNTSSSSQLLPGEIVLTSAGKNSLLMDNIQVTATAIPEPSSTALLGCGLALWFGTRRRVKSS